MKRIITISNRVHFYIDSSVKISVFEDGKCVEEFTTPQLKQASRIYKSINGARPGLFEDSKEYIELENKGSFYIRVYRYKVKVGCQTYSNKEIKKIVRFIDTL